MVLVIYFRRVVLWVSIVSKFGVGFVIKIIFVLKFEAIDVGMSDILMILRLFFFYKIYVEYE